MAADGVPAAAASLSTSAMQPPEAPAFNFGDLVRVSDSVDKSNERMSERIGQLGRVSQCNNDDKTVDVDWVLGGRTARVERAFLVHTTEQVVGSKRIRRERKQPDMIDPTPASMRKYTKKAKPVPKKKTAKVNPKSQPAKSKSKPVKQNSKKTEKATTKKPKKDAAVPKKKATGKKRKLEEAKPAEPPKPAVPDLFQRHSREFERIVTRIEKLDPFGWFHDAVPAAYEENYGEQPSEASAENASSKPASPKKGGKRKPVVFRDHPPYNWPMVRRRMEQGRYIRDHQGEADKERQSLFGTGKRKTRLLHPLGIHWDLFKDDVVGMCDMAAAREDESEADCRGSLTSSAKKVKEALLQSYEKTGKKQMSEMFTANLRLKFWNAIEKSRNKEAAMQSWRKNEFPERRYEKLSEDKVCAGLSTVDEHIASYELRTNLPDSFVGISYRYDDTGQSEAWMKSIVDETGSNTEKSRSTNRERQAAMALAADDGVTRAQVNATMQTLLIGVQDKVMTDRGTLNQSELKSANWAVGDADPQESKSKPAPEIVEQPVWGIDCYTRRNICTCLETELDHETAVQFVEKWLLPAINACPTDIAHDISNATRILEGLWPQEIHPDGAEESTDADTSNVWKRTLLGEALQRKIESSAPAWLTGAALTLRKAYKTLGPDFFRVHPKGHGSVLLCSRVPANRLVTFYRGEVYPSWRWGEKMDAIEITQQRKSLKPALPDFYNMALERPQVDPRGYGLLFVDASRKAGHGSSLSHSCAPTCEVRVAAVNGELTLAMTTLRELEMGEELTFDYNAVTESLNEYSSAVCLCGYSKCRGSFLHFATADCYQSVLNRNAPIATRFSNLVKGSMKQVMSDDDTKVLKSHGFRTAAFGAISVNRRNSSDEERSAVLDNIDIVPIWLRTYVADTLRYIEYERRALPIALICDHISSSRKTKKSSAKDEQEPEEPAALPDLKEPKLEPTFFFFVRTEKEKIKKMLVDEGIPTSTTGAQLNSAVRKVGSGYWQSLSDEVKKEWKKRAADDFAKRKKEWQASMKKSSKGQKAAAQSKKRARDMNMTDLLNKSDISFQDADAEGVSAMEQRIQQLTQALSRVGRVLDRHREGEIMSDPKQPSSETDSECLRGVAHAPLVVCPDSQVIEWIWNREDGAMSSMLRLVSGATFARPELSRKLNGIKVKYACLSACGVGSDGQTALNVLDMSQGRRQLSEALLECRRAILEDLKEMGKIYNRYRKLSVKAGKSGPSTEQKNDAQLQPPEPVSSSGEKVTGSDELAITGDTSSAIMEVGGKTEIAALLEDMVTEVERRLEEDEVISAPRSKAAKHANEGQGGNDPEKLLQTNPWIKFYNQRFVLQTTADLLLFYANTKTFFAMQPYRCLESTPIEVYARELGNTVPKTAIDDIVSERHSVPNSEPRTTTRPSPAVVSPSDDSKSDEKPELQENQENGQSLPGAGDLCLPDDIVAEVTVSYGGDYVLSQLLQWYNGGIGQKPGLPDMSGCALLPQISDCFACELLKDLKEKPERKTRYESDIRPKLIEWFQDPYQRGGPLPDQIKVAFEPSGGESPSFRVFGSPIVDFLVTGDESSIFETLANLDSDNRVASKSAQDGLLSSVDKGRPAQAVSTWVQCEHAECLKWRKIPWHVDIDLLPEKFYCKDNIWNPNGNSCEKPQDDWDQADATVGADGKVEGSPVRKRKNTELSPSEESSFTIGARFDVERNGKFVCGTVRKVDFSGKVKRIFFSFAKVAAKYDEWIEFGSPRIYTRHSKVVPPQKKPKQPPVDKVSAQEKQEVNPKVPAKPSGVAAVAGGSKSETEASKMPIDAVVPVEKLSAAASSQAPPENAMSSSGNNCAGSASATGSTSEMGTAEDYSKRNPPVFFASTPSGSFVPTPVSATQATQQGSPTMQQNGMVDAGQNGAAMMATQIRMLASMGYNVPPELLQAYAYLQQANWQTHDWGQGS